MSSRYLIHLLLLVVLPVALLVARPKSSSAQCSPATCPTAVHVSFESVVPGASVEGLGAVHPDLAITSVAWPFGSSCTPGTAAGIENGNATFVAYGTAGSTPNGCLTGMRGFGDSTGCVLDYDFTFASGISVSCFSIRMVDFGDLLPFGGTTHTVTVTGYDASSAIVDQDQLVMSGGVDLVAGDACTAQAGDPGNHLFTVTGAGIVRVTLTFDAFPDPNVGFDDISFCPRSDPTSSDKKSWGELKIRYRD